MSPGNDVAPMSSSGDAAGREPGAEKPLAAPTGIVAISPAIESARLPEEELASLVEAGASRLAAKALPNDIAGKGSRRR